ncbi:MAG: ATP-binding protein [Thiomicrorhabdus chilensis]|uniref:hybrid sensor histidine kinase/response regulator n=1 Tax=Thiomicrorhabdus chilensis TaxID=63656 RepID=UPI00299D53B5|nr:ATP-binding protein [Thiomicrorhabdus chilensis]MDX1347071.1 ATP-binding protein [Thiomicrorhabdus chilensis]
MNIDKQPFNSWVIDEVLWWRCEVGSTDFAIQCSSALQNLFDHSVLTMDDLVGSHDAALIHLKINEVLEFPQRDTRFVCTFDTKHGALSYQHRLKVFAESGKKFIFAECIDVTEMVALSKEMVDAQGRLSLTQVYERQSFLEEQNRLIQESYNKQSRFLALLSHELRSPLLGINSMVTHLKQHYAQDQYLAERLRIINLTSEQMMFLVNDILTYSQTEYDAISLHPRRFSLNQTFDYVKQLTKSIAIDKGVFVSLVYLGERDWVYGDSIRLSQILINLIVNGIKFTRLGGVSVEVRQESGDRFSFMVMDSGEGIEAEKLEKIFDPFTQFKTEGATRTLGSGLGLSVVKQLVDLMGGEISVSSTPGVGTTFIFTLELPAAETDSDKSKDGKQLKEQTAITEPDYIRDEQPLRVLVVDDSKINRMVLSGYLKELDCTVVEAADGLEAWTEFQKQPFDFVFLDIQMPQMDGFEVMQHIQQCKQEGKVPNLRAVFAVTAGGGEELIPKGQTLQSLGFKKWLVKPISKSQVIELLTESPAKSSLTQQKKMEKKDEVDEAELKVEFEDVPTAFHALLKPFVEEFSQNLNALESAVEQENWDEVKLLAHYMKGNCMVFQLVAWVEVLREVESLAGRACQFDENKKILRLRLKTLEKALKHLENLRLIRDNAD